MSLKQSSHSMPYRLNTEQGPFWAAAGASQPSAAVLLLPAIAGVNRYVESVAGRLNAAGKAVLALDYHAGSAPDLSSRERIEAAVAEISDVAVMDAVRRAADFLRTRSDIDHAAIGALGFCIGGSLAILAAAQVDGLGAAVSYYGRIRYAERTPRKPLAPLEAAAGIKAPLLLHYGDADQTIPLADVDAFAAALAANGKSYERFVYGGAPHAFDEDFRPNYRPASSREAWARTLAFLDWHLRPGAAGGARAA